MANLISWLGGGVKRLENTINNDVVKPLQRDVIRPIAGADRRIIGAGRSIGQGIAGAGIPLGVEAYNRTVAPAFHLPQQTFNTAQFGRVGTNVLGKSPVLSPSQIYNSTKQAGHGKPLALGLAGLTAAAALPGGSVGRVAAKKGLEKAAAKRIVSRVELPPRPESPGPKINRSDTAVRSTTGVLNKIDPRLASMVTQRREIAEVGAAKAKNNLKLNRKLNANEQSNLLDVLKGTQKPINEKVSAALPEVRKTLDNAYYTAKAVGVPVKAYRKNYAPQILNPKTFKEGSKQFDAQVQHLKATKQAKTDAEAIGLLRKYKNSRTVSPYGNLAKSRTLDLQGYAKNNAALDQYLDRAYATIAHHKVMGPEDKFLNKVLADVRNNGGDVEQAIKSYRQASGLVRGSEGGEKVARTLTNIQGTTKLGLSSILNATQPANTAIIAGAGRTAKTYVKALAKRDKEFLNRTGVADEQVAHEALFSEQGVTPRLRKFTAPFFEAVEKQNRRSSALAGKDMANSLAKKALKGNAGAAKKLRTEFGIDKVGKTGLTEDQQIKAARNLTERSQFRTGNQDLPGWTGSPTGKVISQFRRYPYKQAQFLGREVLKPIARGNLLPAARLAALGVPVGLGAHAAQDKLRGGSFQNTPAETALQTFNNATGGDLLSSLARSLVPGSSPDANAYINKITKTTGGPTASDALKAVQGGFEAAKGDATNAKRFGLTHVPVLGTPVSNRVLPYNNQSAAPVANPTTPQEKVAAAKAEKKTLEADPSIGNGSYMRQLTNGQYAYWVDSDTQPSYTGDKKTAQNAIAEASLKASGESYKIVGQTVYRKGLDGNINTEPKIKFDYQLNGATLTAQKNAGDLDGWLKTAKTQMDNITKQLKDPNIDPLDQLTLQNAADALQKNIDKYTGYGGFTKPKSASERIGARAKAISSFKTSSSGKTIAKPKGVSVRVPKAPTFKAPKTRKLSVSKIPSNYLNKKLV